MHQITKRTQKSKLALCALTLSCAVGTMFKLNASEVLIGEVPEVNLGYYIIEQLQCKERPEVTKIMISLAMNDQINLKNNVGYDSISCFDIIGDFSIDGLPVSKICGVTEDDIDWFLFPDLYFRGPGTFPPENLEIYTPLNTVAAHHFAKTHKLNVDVEDSGSWGTAIGCWSWNWEHS